MISGPVVFYGTSLTASQPWTNTIALDRTDLNVVNSAMSAKASDWGQAQLQTRVLALHPSAVVIEFATNDAYQPYNISLVQAAINTWAMVRAVQATGAEVFLMTMNPVGPDVQRPELETYNALYRAIAQVTGAHLIDTAGEWGSYLPPDHVHPTLEVDQQILVPAILSSFNLFNI